MYGSEGASQADLENYEELDTSVPHEIDDEHEHERRAGLLTRDNLVRGLGIVEHVYRLLECTKGTMSMQTKADRYHAVSVALLTHTLLLDIHRKRVLVSTNQGRVFIMSMCLESKQKTE